MRKTGAVIYAVEVKFFECEVTREPSEWPLKEIIRGMQLLLFRHFK